MKVSRELAGQLGMSETEWEFLVERLQRLPSFEELQMIGVMWSEHCSYKSSKFLLKELETRSDRVLQGPGENAGLVSWGKDHAIAFKVESHNHPSFVEPFQGAATGVGGILRDIFTMGARPLAIANYLRFGDLRSPLHQRLLEGVVSGIAHYGNCMGIPNLGGQLHTDKSYDHNILVNVFALGILPKSRVYLSNTAKPGASVMIWGARTGRDGVHGASLLASADFEGGERDDLEQKIRVQVGDPFKEKVLMEACLECMEEESENLLAIQDMGAAGLTCSTMEIAAKSGVGMKVNLDQVPLREKGMQAFELLLSESQERMLAVVKKGSEEKFQKILRKWGVEAEVIGETTADARLKMEFQGEICVNLPVQEVMDPPPIDWQLEDYQVPEVRLDGQPADVTEEWSVLKYLLQQPRLASKRSIYERFDSSVGAASVMGPGAEAALLHCPTSENPYQALAFKGSADEAIAEWNPKRAAELSMAECARALACVGATPLGITDGVNLGNPHSPDVLPKLKEFFKGLNEGIRTFKSPCVSGNVSLYNQTQIDGQKKDIEPTIFLVMVGETPDVRRVKPSAFQKAGNEVWLLEAFPSTQSLPFGSFYARKFWPEGWWRADWPECHLDLEEKFHSALREALEEEIFVSIRDLSDGGLAVALAEACIQAKETLGFDGDLSKTQKRRDLLLFAETSGRVIVEIEPEKRSALLKMSREAGFGAHRLGQLTEEENFRLRPLCLGKVSELKEAYYACFR